MVASPSSYGTLEGGQVSVRSLYYYYLFFHISKCRANTQRDGARPYRCVDPIAPLDRRLYIQPESARSCHLCYSHWAAWSSAPDPSLNSRCPHARLLLPRHAQCSRWDPGPWTHAHPPCWHTALCLARASASPTELRHSASLHHRTTRHPGQRSTLCTAAPLTLLCTAQLSVRHLSCTYMCTSLHRAPRCTSPCALCSSLSSA